MHFRHFNRIMFHNKVVYFENLKVTNFAFPLPFRVVVCQHLDMLIVCIIIIPVTI
jgi:hypothetical protein